MAEVQSDQSRLDELAEAFVERYRRGEQPAISEYQREHPDLAEQIEELFPALAIMEQVESDLRKATKKLPAAAKPATPPTQLGDFRILREVGRGGMGVVYEAEQVSLGRRVALKVLPKHLLSDSKHRKRFEREARAAGRLHHTNIVPVYGVGEQDGMHYYVMQFIDGLALDEVLVELKRLREESEAAKRNKICQRANKNGQPAASQPKEAPYCAGNAAAPTLEVSAAGIANSLVSGRFELTMPRDSDSGISSNESPRDSAEEMPEDSPPEETINGRRSETLHGSGAFALPGQSESHSKSSSRNVYWQSVARIGVQAAEALHYAHEQGVIHRDVKPGNLLLDTRGCVWITDFGLAKAADEQSLTHTGDVLGTLRYMAPEQFDGNADARSDTYSLGLTLYEMLAMRPAFDATSRVQLIDQVLHESPPRLRTLDGRIPRDLETIVHKAMERDPYQRFVTAHELAADLQRCLGGEPIRARRLSPFARFHRWCKRNKTLAALSLFVAALLVLGVVVSTAAALAFRGQRNELNVAMAEIGRKHDLLEQERNRAVAAEWDRTDHLVDATYEKVRGHRAAGRMGRRFHGLASIAEATGLLRSLDLPADQLDARLLRLRNEAIACMALPDFEDLASWKLNPSPGGSHMFAVDRRHLHFAREEEPGVITLRRTADQSLVTQFRKRGATAGWMQFSHDGRRLAVSYSGLTGLGFCVWNVTTCDVVLEGPITSPIRSLDFSPCEPYFAIASADGLLQVFDLDTEREIQGLPVASGSQYLRFSPDGNSLAMSTESGKLFIWDWRTGNLTHEWEAPGRLHGIDWGAGGKTIAVACDDGNVYVRDLTTHREVVLKGHRHVATDVAFHPQGRFLFSAGWDGTTRVWDLNSQTELLQTYGQLHHLSSEGGQLSVSLENHTKIGIREFDPADECRMLYGHYDTATHIHNSAFSTRLPLLATCGSDGVRLWDTANWREVAALDTGWTPSVAFHPRTGHLWTASQQGLYEWPLRTTPDEHSQKVRIGPPQRIETPGISSPHRLVVSADGGALCVNGEYGEQHVLILRADGSEPIRAGWHQNCRFTALSPDSRWSAVGPWTGQGVAIFDVANGKRVHQLPSVGATSVAFSPDGKWLATCDADAVRFYQVGSWELSHAYPTPGVGYITFSPDSALLALGKLLAGEEPNAVLLIQTATGRLLARLENTPAPTQIEEQITFSADGGHLVAPHWRDRVFCVWDLRAIRRRLSRMGLDWDAPPLSRPADRPAPMNLSVIVPSSISALIDRLGFGYSITKQEAQLVDDALEDLSRAIENDPHQALWWVLRGRLRWALGRDREALRDFSEAIARDPENVSAYYYRARTNWWAHNPSEAIQDYQKVLKREPDHARALLEGAMCYVHCPPWRENAKHALDLTQRYLDRHGNASPVLHTQGVALYRLGRFEESEQTIQRAIQRGVNWLKPHLALAAIYHQRGETDRAFDAFRVAQTEGATKPSSQNTRQNHQWRQEVANLLGICASPSRPQPEATIVLDAHQLLTTTTATEGRVQLRASSQAKSSFAFNWYPSHTDACLTCRVTAPHPGRYRVSGRFQKSNTSGRIQITIAEQTLANSFDGYAPQKQPSEEFVFGEAEFIAGENDLTIEIIGSHSSSDGYQVCVDRLELTPVASTRPTAKES